MAEVEGTKKLNMTPEVLWFCEHYPIPNVQELQKIWSVSWSDEGIFRNMISFSNNYILICDLLGSLISLANIFCSWWRQPPKTELYICHCRSLSQVGLESKDETRIHTLIDGWLSGIHGTIIIPPRLKGTRPGYHALIFHLTNTTQMNKIRDCWPTVYGHTQNMSWRSSFVWHLLWFYIVYVHGYGGW